MLTQPTVFEGPDAEARLASLGLVPEELVRVAQRARVEAASCTDFDALGTAGFLLWSRFLRFLREELVVRGWESRRPRGSELTLNTSVGIKIIVTSGDKWTGSPYGNPQPKNPKGPTFFEAVVSNQSPLDFGPEFDEPDAYVDPEVLESLTTWIAIYRLTKSGEFFLEISKPGSIDPGGYVHWAERIIVSVPMPEAPMYMVGDSDDEGPYRMTVERLG